jgi:hypothetical protein
MALSSFGVTFSDTARRWTMRNSSSKLARMLVVGIVLACFVIGASAALAQTPKTPPAKPVAKVPQEPTTAKPAPAPEKM